MGGVSADEFKKLKNRMAALEDSNKKLISSNSSIKAKNDLLVKLAKEIVDENAALRKETNFLCSKLNCNNYHTDSVEQYGRRESLDVVHAEEIEDETEKQVVKAVIDRANYVLSQSEHYKDTRVEESDIQRCHRVGKKKESADSSTPPKPRKIICKFKDYKLRQKIIFSKRHLKKHPSFKNSFFTENLTPFRSKLLWYIKNKCDGKFVNVHTRDGNINVQLKGEHEKTDPWYIIRSPEDLWKKFGVVVNLKHINENYLRFEVYEQIEIESHNRFQDLLESVDSNS